MYQERGELGTDSTGSSVLLFLSATSLKFVLPASVLGLLFDIFSVTLFLSDLVNVSFLFKLFVSSIFIKTFLCLSVSIDFCFFSVALPVLVWK